MNGKVYLLTIVFLDIITSFHVDLCSDLCIHKYGLLAKTCILVNKNPDGNEIIMFSANACQSGYRWVFMNTCTFRVGGDHMMLYSTR